MNASSTLVVILRKRMKGQHPNLFITPTRLRRSWMLEQMVTWEKLHIFLQAAGVQSMRSVDSLLDRCPRPTTDPARAAEALGGVPARGRD
jgi:hypothetical protein